MNSKLTLKLRNEAISKAKKYAKSNNTSVSKLVEDYFILLEDSPKRVEYYDDIEITPNVKKLMGVITTGDLEKVQEGYTDYLVDKYKI